FVFVVVVLCAASPTAHITARPHTAQICFIEASDVTPARAVPHQLRRGGTRYRPCFRLSHVVLSMEVSDEFSAKDCRFPAHGLDARIVVGICRPAACRDSERTGGHGRGGR